MDFIQPLGEEGTKKINDAFRKINICGRSSMAFGLRCIPRHSFLNRFAEVASMP